MSENYEACITNLQNRCKKIISMSIFEAPTFSLANWSPISTARHQNYLYIFKLKLPIKAQLTNIKGLM